VGDEVEDGVGEGVAVGVALAPVATDEPPHAARSIAALAMTMAGRPKRFTSAIMANLLGQIVLLTVTGGRYSTP
jgi:hypothetical protein